MAACCSSTTRPPTVFANPVNTFVAGFVGSPAMSLIPVEFAVRRRPDGR